MGFFDCFLLVSLINRRLKIILSSSRIKNELLFKFVHFTLCCYSRITLCFLKNCSFQQRRVDRFRFEVAGESKPMSKVFSYTTENSSKPLLREVLIAQKTFGGVDVHQVTLYTIQQSLMYTVLVKDEDTLYIGSFGSACLHSQHKRAV
jgi:hypothetical protein